MKKTVIALTLSALASPSFAGGNLPAPQERSWVTSLSVGPFWSRGGRDQLVNLTPDISRIYTADHARHARLQGEIFAGLCHDHANSWQSHVGLAFAATDKVRLNGEVWDDADPQFNNHVYQYKLQHTHVAVKGKALFGLGHAVMPYVSGSVGAGWNRASHFTNVAIIDSAIASSNFANHTKRSVTYTVGAGVQHPINEHWQMGLGYEFADWGRSYLDPAVGQTTSRALTLQHFYTHGLMLNVTHLS